MPSCAIVAARPFDFDSFALMRDRGDFAYVIAVDAGLSHLERIGCKPDLILGDFDSLGYVPVGSNVIRHPTHKDASDLELALAVAEGKGGGAVVFGALGGRQDHAVAALQVCARYAERGMRMRMVGEDCAVSILTGPGRLSFPAGLTGTVSVFSATDASLGVTEEGLEYALADARLTNRTTLGLSNELIGQPASISVEKGTLYVFHPLSGL